MLIKLPMCPTSNHMYASVNGRLIKSAEARRYEQGIEIIKLKLCRLVDEFKSTLKDDSILQVDLYFVFPHKKYFCKDGSLRRFDYSNRHKIAFDSVSKILSIDDSLFIDGRSMKTYWDKDEETIFVKIKELPKPIPWDELSKWI